MAVLTYLCAEHGTNLVGASPVMGIYRQSSELQVSTSSCKSRGCGMKD